MSYWFMGDKGESGQSGVVGPKGDKGTSGENGINGLNGIKGEKGHAYNDTLIVNKVEELETNVNTLDDLTVKIENALNL